MSATIEGHIEAALFARVAALALTPAMVVAWPNKAFTPPAEGYLRVTHVPNVNRRLTIGSADPHQRLGLLQVSVFLPLNKGSSPATEIAGAIAAHFPADLRMRSGNVTVKVERKPDVSQGTPDGAYWHVPVMIRHQTII